MIDIAQYGFDTDESPDMGAADYKLAVDVPSTGRKLYTFCMCPGGEVVGSQITDDRICTNGMSYRARHEINSNSALLVPVGPEDFGDGPLDGLYFRENLEKKAFEAGGKRGKAPYCTYGDLAGIQNESVACRTQPTFMPGVTKSDFKEIFPDSILATIKDGIALMGNKIKGFDDSGAVLTAVEAGSSSPVRILRSRETCQSINTEGLYPCGEGAGYAGGIMSSAIDGINCANALISSLFDV